MLIQQEEEIQSWAKEEIEELLDDSKPYTMWRTYVVGSAQNEDIKNWLNINERAIQSDLCQNINLKERLDLDFYALDWEPKKLIQMGGVSILMGRKK